MKCVHCLKAIHPDDLFRYPLSRATAHLACVSVPSMAETDAWLHVQQQSPTRRVYSTGVRGKRS